MKSNYKPIGNYVKQVKLKNTDNSLTVEHLRGIRINKEFMPSVANVTGTDLSKYRVVKRYQFAYNPMHVGRDEILPISMLADEEAIIVSPAYVIFEIIDTNELLPEYLMIWCRRSEFDRNAWFTTDSSVRGGFSWDDFCGLELPVPSIDKQKEIIKEYHTIEKRIKLNEQLNQKLEETAQTIYKEWFVDFEFPDENGKPYKSSGGDINELKVDILSNYVHHLKKTINPQKLSKHIVHHFSLPAFDNNQLVVKEYGDKINSTKYKVDDNAILISKLNPHFSRVWNLIGTNHEYSICSTEFQVFIPKLLDYFSYILCFLKSKNTIAYLSNRATGTSNSHQRVKPEEILNIPILNPGDNIVSNFNKLISPLFRLIKTNKEEINSLLELKEILLSKMATIKE